MTNDDRVKAAKEFYEKAKSVKSEKKYTLSDIAGEEFVLLGKDDKFDSENGTDSKENWYSKRYKQFREMLKAFDIFEEFKKIKPKGKGYSFTERNKTFIMMLFREYTGKFEHLKRGDIPATDGAYLLEVYSGFLDIFYDFNADDKLIETVMLKMWNRLNIPQRNMDAVLDSVYDQCKRMVQANVSSASIGMGVREKLFWQTAFRYAFYEFIYRWDKFYEIMEEIRKDEVLEKAEIEAASASPEWKRCAEIEFALSSEITAAYEQDPELRRLNAERDSLLGVGQKHRPLIRDVEKDFEKCTLKLTKRMREVELETIRKQIPDFNYPDGWDKLPEVDFRFTPLKKLLETAIKDEKEQREWSPVISIDDLLGRIKRYFP